MKNSKGVIAGVAAALLLAAGITIGAGVFGGARSAVLPPAGVQESAHQRKVITVAGRSTVQVEPSIAYVTVGVVTEDPDVKAAQNDNAAKMEAVYKALEGLQIPKTDIKTQSYDIYPRYDYDGRQIEGFSVRNSIRITVRDLGNLNKVLDLTVEQGINESNEISFAVTDEERARAYQSALDAAVKDAEAKAAAIAQSTGVKLGKPLSIVESGSEMSPNMAYKEEIAYAVADRSADTPVSGGLLEVPAEVTIHYEY
jgi:uncharacterized protein YggE